MWDNTTGGYNSTLGHAALYNNTTGSYNTSIGRDTMYNNTTAHYNTALGAGAMYSNTTGSSNIAVGYNSLSNNTVGTENVGVGRNALSSVTTSHENVAMGFGAGAGITTGGRNTCIGDDSCNYGAILTTGSYNCAVGTFCGTSSAASVHQISLGYNIKPPGNYYFAFGEGATNRVYNKFDANASWTRSSDERLKKEIKTNTDCGLGFINDLRTVTYKWKAPSDIAVDVEGHNANITQHSHTDKMYGFVAQEVKAAMDTHNITDFAGWTETPEDQGAIQGISYEMFVMPLVKAVQELSAENKALMTRIQALEA
jgi:hypothetical protein